ncbi:MAG TPA: addiction module toxin, HicA family [Cyanobacteria bacterium UBA8530]|nr:addiction module toxin, HicA family [Cyanobacteria bacterium UBA8530]
MTGKEMVKLLKKSGWTEVRVSGSHHILVRGDQEMSVPIHANRDLPTGTEQQLLKKAGLK